MGDLLRETPVSKLNPGSPAAIAAGCRCPVLDNGHGRGSGWGPGEFWISGDCPLHWPRPENGGCKGCGRAGVLATIKPFGDETPFNVDHAAVYCTACRKVILGDLFYKQPGNDEGEALEG